MFPARLDHGIVQVLPFLGRQHSLNFETHSENVRCCLHAGVVQLIQNFGELLRLGVIVECGAEG